MMSQRLSVSELMEGGLAKFAENSVPVMAFVIADVLLAWALLWAEAGVEAHPALVVVIYLLAAFLLSSLLTLALGGKLLELLRNPEELVTRIVFALVAAIIAIVGVGLGAVFLIVPGLYVSARWFIVAPLMLLDGTEIVEGLGRSWKLTEASAWPLVGVSIVSLLPSIFPLFTNSGLNGSTGLPELGLVAEWIVTSSVWAFSVAVAVFAWRRLTGQIDELEQTFA